MTGDGLLETHHPHYTLRLHRTRLMMTTSWATVTSRTNSRYSHRVHVTAVIPQVYGLLPYYRSQGLEPYRPSLQGHIAIPASQFSRLVT
ncbi:UNVERIFIED_CONTAM: hypothetical protein Slati_0397900 [Sesamum latifolium]|uniref:Uncharacterized protein n=1 Tax=Sesamum latifolium TaxID=2727402 RepID=A0AAW2XU97_9LAMI